MIEFTGHADRKIKQRNLKKALVKETLNKPDYVLPGYSNREISYKKIVKLYLAVVFVREEDKIIVLTAYWDKSFKSKKKEAL